MLGGYFMLGAFFAAGIACKALLKFDAPGLEVALGGAVTIAVGRTGFAAYETTRVRQTAMEHNITNIPTAAPSTIPPGA